MQKTETPAAVTIAALADTYKTKTADFIAGAKALVTKVQKHRAETPEVGQAIITVGLHCAVLVREFITNLAAQPAWFGKTADDFCRHSFGIGAKEYFPPKAYSNARLALAVTVRWDESGISTGIFPEEDYLETSQRGLDILGKIVFHEKTKGPKGADSENPTVVRAVAVARKRAKKYVASLQSILDELDGKEEETDEFDPIAAIIGLETVIRSLGDATDAQKASEIVAGIFRLSDVLTYKSGLDSDTLSEYAKAYVMPKDVAEELAAIEKAESERVAAENAAKKAAAEKVAEELIKAHSKPVEPAEIAAPDFAAWVAANQYSDEMKREIGLDQAELDQSMIEMVEAIYNKLGRMPRDVHEVDELANAPIPAAA